MTRGSSRINDTRANFTPHHNVAVQRAIQVFFLGCVTCLWAREASHATFFCSTCPDEQNYGVVSCKILLFTQCVDCLLGKMAHRLDFLKHLHVLANEGTGNPHLSNDDKRQRCIFLLLQQRSKIISPNIEVAVITKYSRVWRACGVPSLLS